MHIETTGHGPGLILIHGWAMHGGLFAPLVERLRDRYTVHAVDLPGHGHAATHDTPLEPERLAAALADRLPDAVWLGWSMGGQVALRAALDHPARVRGLVMLASSPRFVRGEGWPHGVSSTLFGDFGDALQRDFRGTLEGFLALEALGSASAQVELRKLRAQAFERGEPSPRALQEGLVLLDELDLEALRHARLCELNVVEQVVNVCRTTVIRDAWARGQKVGVHGWVYSLLDGRVRELGMGVDSPEELPEAYALAMCHIRGRGRDPA